MPRPPRLHVPGGHYHVILRGNHREALFGLDADRRVLNDIVGEVTCDVGARIHSFCWMTNHLHILVQVADQPLGLMVKRVAMRYSRYRHKQLQTAGHLFERRHKAKLIDVDAYFLTLLRYIHRNPVKAGLVADPSDYPWTSHRAYLGTESIPWLTTEFGLSLFARDLARARRSYREFVTLSLDDDEAMLTDATTSIDSRILGSDQFVANIPKANTGPRSTLTLEQIAESICAQHGVGVDLVRSRSALHVLTPIRMQIASTAIEQRAATLTQVASFLGRDPSTVSLQLIRHSKNIKQSKSGTS